ncbi:unnamed protein product, partial [marine sediment metagenome]
CVLYFLNQKLLWGEIWKTENIGNAGSNITEIAIGDGDNDGNTEIYGGDINGHIYKFSCSNSIWSSVDIGVSSGVKKITIDDGNCGIKVIFFTSWGLIFTFIFPS